MARARNMMWGALVGASLGLGSPALAGAGNERSMVVVARRCVDLDTSRIRALFDLELGTAADRVGIQLLTVTCGATQTRLEVESWRMGRIERVLETSLDREEPERIVAFAAAQLVLAAWVEPPRERPPPDVAYAPAPPAAEASAPSATGSKKLDAQFDAGVRARPLGPLAIGPAFSLSGVAWQGHWGVLAGASADRVTSSRTLGVAELTVGELELSAAWRSTVDGALSFEWSLGPALALVHLRGVDPAASVRAGAVTAVALDAKAKAALRYRRGSLSFRLAIDGGYLVSGAEGTISSDATILARGPWAGLMLGGGAAW